LFYNQTSVISIKHFTRKKNIPQWYRPKCNVVLQFRCKNANAGTHHVWWMALPWT